MYNSYQPIILNELQASTKIINDILTCQFIINIKNSLEVIILAKYILNHS